MLGTARAVAGRTEAELAAKRLGAAEFLENDLLTRFVSKPKLNRYFSWGTITREYFRFPQRYMTNQPYDARIPWHQAWHQGLSRLRTRCAAEVSRSDPDGI